jgi:hypothetical protein
MKRMITALSMVFVLVGYVGLPSIQAAASNTDDPVPFKANLRGDNSALNGVRDRDTTRQFHIGDGERPSHYPPYYRSEQ